MRSGESELFILLPLLPIFFVGAFPMLLLSLLGFGGLVTGISDDLRRRHRRARGQQLLQRASDRPGYTRQSERAVQRTNLRSEIHFAFLMIVAGMGMAGAGLCGLYFG